MNLLLFISALLAGLTGAVTGGQRADFPAVQQSIGQAIEIASENAAQRQAPVGYQLAAAFRLIDSASAACQSWALLRAAPENRIGSVFGRLLI